jgi:putative lipoprotein
MSPGVFCMIKYLPSRNAYSFTSNQGQNTINNFDAKDTERRNGTRIGMNNGLIVGYGNLSDDGSGYHFYAFDAQCPVCFNYNAIPMRSYPLSLSGSGIATCANCKREFNLNTGGNCINNTGKMTTYRATTAGPFGFLFIN